MLVVLSSRFQRLKSFKDFLELTSTLDLLKVGSKFTRPACRSAAVAIGR